MTERSQLIELTAEIVASFVSCNPLPAADLPAFISSTYAALAALREPCEQERSHAGAAVPIDESIHDDYLVCLEDGRKLKSLKRHLQHRYGMTPDQYRSKWGCPPTIRWSHRPTRRCAQPSRRIILQVPSNRVVLPSPDGTCSGSRVDVSPIGGIPEQWQCRA